MNNMLAENLIKFRKNKGLTQENLACKLGVTHQSVSKWETGQSYPDISILPDLAFVLETSIDSLMGFIHDRRKVTIYEDEYLQENYYWGLKPSSMCYKVLQKLPPTKPLRLLDIGCGEGKDSVFFARNGYIVTAFDFADAGVNKTKKLADQYNVNINVFKANVLEFKLDTEFDIIFSSGVFHYIKPDLRQTIINNYKKNTSIGGMHMLNVFVPKPFIAPAPEKEPTSTIWKTGELFSLYSDWLIHESSEVIFDCNSSGISHKHCMDILMSERVL